MALLFSRIKHLFFSNSADRDYLKSAKTYWKYAPGGTGKLNTDDLLKLTNEEFLSIWQSNLDLRRTQYWEEKHFIKIFCDNFKLSNKKILSFGCGLGYAEMEFLERGAYVLFTDIIPSNVDCVRRLCQLRRFKRADFMVMEDSASIDFGQGFDCIFAYGSLMHMPEDRQRRVLKNFSRCLAPDGVILLMLYTEEFVKAKGGTYDQREFARLTDPDVGSTHNPWSDWHNDEKLRKLAPNDLWISNRQLFNEDFYVWYGLRKRNSVKQVATPKEFADLVLLEESQHRVIHRFEPSSFTVTNDAVSIKKNGQMLVKACKSNFSYLLVSAEAKISQFSKPPNTLAFNLKLDTGGVSVGILNVEKDEFICSRICTGLGQRDYYLSVPNAVSCKSWQIIVSNFQPNLPDTSSFIIENIRLVEHSTL